MQIQEFMEMSVLQQEVLMDVVLYENVLTIVFVKTCIHEPHPLPLLCA